MPYKQLVWALRKGCCQLLTCSSGECQNTCHALVTQTINVQNRRCTHEATRINEDISSTTWTTLCKLQRKLFLQFVAYSADARSTKNSSAAQRLNNKQKEKTIKTTPKAHKHCYSKQGEHMLIFKHCGSVLRQQEDLNV